MRIVKAAAADRQFSLISQRQGDCQAKALRAWNVSDQRGHPADNGLRNVGRHNRAPLGLGRGATKNIVEEHNAANADMFFSFTYLLISQIWPRKSPR